MTTQCALALFVKGFFQPAAELVPEAPGGPPLLRPLGTLRLIFWRLQVPLHAEAVQEGGDSLTPGHRGQNGKEGRGRSGPPPSCRRGISAVPGGRFCNERKGRGPQEVRIANDLPEEGAFLSRLRLDAERGEDKNLASELPRPRLATSNSPFKTKGDDEKKAPPVSSVC